MKNLIIAVVVLLWLIPASAAHAQENWDELNKKSMTAYTAKDYEAAFRFTQQALAQAQKEFGTDSRNYSISAHNMAYLHGLRKEYAESSKYYLQSIDIRKKLNLEADLAMSSGQYGSMLYRGMKDLANAEKHLLTALDLNKKLYGEKSSQYYGVASELAMLYMSAEKYQQAEPYYLYMKQAMKEQKGATHEDYAEVLSFLMKLYNNFTDKSKYWLTTEEFLDVAAVNGMDTTMYYFNGMFLVADYYEKQENPAKAISIYNKMLPSLKKAYSDTSKHYAVPLAKMIGLYNKQDDYKNVGLIAEELVNVLKRRPEDRDLYLDGLLASAVVFTRTADYQKAEESLRLFTLAAKKERGIADTTYQRGVTSLAKVQLELGKYKEAEANYRENLKNRSKDINYVSDMLSMGYLVQLTGRIEQAELIYRDALQLLQSLKLERSNEYGVLLNYMARIALTKGDTELGKKLLNQALSIYSVSVGKDQPNYALVLWDIADLYKFEGDYDQAEVYYTDFMSIYRKYYGDDHPEYATALIKLSSFYRTLGNNAKAEEYLFKALDIQQKRLPVGHPVFLATYSNLGVIYNNSFQYDKAEKYFRLAMEIAKRSFGEQRDYLNGLINLASIYSNSKDYIRSEDIYRQAHTLAQKLEGVESVYYADVLDGLATMYDDQEKYSQAEQYFLQALPIYQKSLPAGNKKLADLYLKIAGTYRALRQPEKAAPYYEKLRATFFSSVDKTFSFLSESEKQSFLNDIEVRFASLQNFYLDYQKQNPAVADQAYLNELAIKGLTLAASVEMRKVIEQSNNNAALLLYDNWMSVRAEISKISTGTESISLSSLEQKADDLEKQLTRISAKFSEGRILSKTSLEDVRQKLGDNDVAIEFASFLRNDGGKWQDSVIYAAIVLRKGDQHPKMIRLAESRQLEEIMQKKGQDDDGFVSSLYRGTTGTNALNTNNSLSNGKRLYDLIWKPIDHLLKEGDKVYFAPSGVLHQIAFAAIPYGDDKLLSDRYKLNQLSSTAMLLKNENTATGKTIALFGGIKYDLTPAEKAAASRSAGTKSNVPVADAGRKGNAWAYLPGTLTETQAISRQAEGAGYTTKTYFGADGMEENMKKLAGKDAPGIVHIASHGFFFPDPKLNYQEKERAGKNVFASSDNAMNRSGMLFAGANDAWTGKASATAEDGILTAYEASNLSLSNTSLVVLSACETGLGDIKGNEGVYGLQRSFKMAGADYLMMSLWKVPDAETAEFMQAFYSGLFGGKAIGSSFTAAQNTMKAKYPKEPYKWAAFVLVN